MVTVPFAAIIDGMLCYCYQLLHVYANVDIERGDPAGLSHLKSLERKNKSNTLEVLMDRCLFGVAGLSHGQRLKIGYTCTVRRQLSEMCAIRL